MKFRKVNGGLPSINRIKCLVWYYLALVPMVSRNVTVWLKKEQRYAE